MLRLTKPPKPKRGKMKKIDTAYFPGFTRKSLTFTIDDGNIEYDTKLLDILRPHGILGTFNLHRCDRLTTEEYRALYSGYEIANHCKNHALVIKEGMNIPISDKPFDAEHSDISYLYKIADGVYNIHIYTYWGKNTGNYEPPRGWHAIAPLEDYKRFAVETKEELEKIFGKGTVKSFAWPHGNGSDGARSFLIEEGYTNIRKTGDLRDRTGFDMPSDRFGWTYNAHDTTLLEVMELYESYPDDGKLKFFSFGVHSADFERNSTWEALEEFARKYGDRPNDYYYGTVADILDYEDALGSLVISEREISNPSKRTLYLTVDGERVTLDAGAHLSLI